MSFIKDISKKFSKAPNGGLTITEDGINKVLSNVIDPDLHKDIVTLGFVRNIEIKGNDIKLDINLTTPACPMKDLLESQAIAELKKLPGIGKIDVKMTAVQSTPQKQATDTSPLAQIKNIIAIASGKGGVGKSTASLSLANALAKTGAKVGLMDADVYGPSIPHLTGVTKPSHMRGNLLIPPVHDGIKMISVSMFADGDKAQILRGPMAGSVVKQFLTQVEWGELDYLIIDYPPGTGDIQLTISQVTPLSGAVIVTTPQEMSLIDVRKAISMFDTLNVPIVGIIENMSYFVCDGCDKKHYIFQQGGGKKLAETLGLPLLGEVPLDPTVVTESEDKKSIINSKPKSAASIAFTEIAGKTARELSIIANSKGEELTSFNLTWRT